MESLQGNNLRYERKFFINHADRVSVEKIVMLHPAFFSEIFHERYVNNIYFDSVGFNNFLDNINGNMHRTKFRIRWYDELLIYIENSALEIKIKEGMVGSKKVFNLLPFHLNDGNINKFQDIIGNSKIDNKTAFSLKNQNPVLLNRYRRKYFATYDNKFRITIDDNQSFYRFNYLNNTFSQRYIDSENVILELKYNNEYDQLADTITNYFPFRLTKSSKYARGIQLLYL